MADPRDAKQAQEGDSVCLLFGAFDPPTMEHYRAAEALLAREGVQYLWACPVACGDPGHVRHMCTIFCADMSASGRAVACCTVGLDKKLDAERVLAWLRGRRPGMKFAAAALFPDVPVSGEAFLQVCLGSAAKPSAAHADPLVLGDFAPVPTDLRKRIGSGSDESRNVPAPVWAYVQANRLYRETP